MNDEQWTPTIGLQNAARKLAIRSAIALPCWALFLWLVTPVLNAMYPHWASFAVVSIAMLFPGFAIGHALARDIDEIAGMTSLVLTAVAVAFGIAVVLVGVELSNLLRPLGEWQYPMARIAPGFWAVLWIVRCSLLAE